jgi:hypothetical protein
LWCKSGALASPTSYIRATLLSSVDAMVLRHRVHTTPAVIVSTCSSPCNEQQPCVIRAATQGDLGHLSIPFVIPLLRKSPYFLCPPLEVADASPNTFYYIGGGEISRNNPTPSLNPCTLPVNVPATFPCLTLSEPVVLCLMQL